LQTPDLSALAEEIEKSKYLKICDDNDGHPPLVHVHQSSNRVSLLTNRGIQIARRYVGGEQADQIQTYRDIVADAEKSRSRLAFVINAN
jgi:hypothetical protein